MLTLPDEVFLEDYPLEEILAAENVDNIKFRHKDNQLYFKFENHVIYMYDAKNEGYDLLDCAAMGVGETPFISLYYDDVSQFENAFKDSGLIFSDLSGCCDYTLAEVLVRI